MTVDIELLKNSKFHGGFKKLIPFSHLFQILYELEKKSSLVTRALSAQSCTRDADSLHSCTRLRLVQEMACLNHSCKIWARKHSYLNLIPVFSTSSTNLFVCHSTTHSVASSHTSVCWSTYLVRCLCTQFHIVRSSHLIIYQYSLRGSATWIGHWTQDQEVWGLISTAEHV